MKTAGLATKERGPGVDPKVTPGSYSRKDNDVSRMANGG
jgi:hypothetical protein